MKYFRGYHGLGDNIYQRPFLRHSPGAYLQTPWPELYEGLDVKSVRTNTMLRTQRKNETKVDCNTWHAEPDLIPVNIGYGPRDLHTHGSIINTFRHQFDNSERLVFDLPSFKCCPIRADRKIAVIRPVTIRAEWDSESRGCDPKYISQAADILIDQGYHVVSVADLEDGKEWLVGDTPRANQYFHKGELSVKQLMSLIEVASVVVTPVGWALPASIAYKIPCYVIAGGRGGHNAPHIVTDPDMDLRKVGWAIPDSYCMCESAKHACEKTISNFTGKFKRWLNVNVE